MHLARSFLSCSLFALALPLSAALNPGQVAADAKWVVHADLNSLRNSAIGKELLAATQQVQAQAQLGLAQEVNVRVDVDKLITTIGSITAYGSNFSTDPTLIDGTLIVEGTADLRKIAESFLLQGMIAAPERVTEVKGSPFPVYAVDGDAPRTPNNKGPKNEVFVAFPPEPIILVSKSRAQLQRARDIINGSAPSLARTPAAPLAKLVKPAAGSFLFAAGMVPTDQPLPLDGPQTRILQMTQSSSLALGETGDRTFAHAELYASSSDTAEKLVKILQGMTAMFSLVETNDDRLKEFLNSTAVTRSGDIVTLHLAYDSRRIVEMVHGVMAEGNRPAAPQPPAARPAMPATRTLDEWTATRSTEPDYAPANAAATRTISSVELKNDAAVTLAWRSNGGRGVSISRLEIFPVAGGSPMIFPVERMRRGNNNGANTATLQFPGVDGSYNLNITYANDPEGKATYTVTTRDPRPAAPAPGRN